MAVMAVMAVTAGTVIVAAPPANAVMESCVARFQDQLQFQFQYQSGGETTFIQIGNGQPSLGCCCTVSTVIIRAQ